MVIKILITHMIILFTSFVFIGDSVLSADPLKELEDNLEIASVEKGFTQAIINSDWNVALSYCCDNIIQVAIRYRNAEAFFKDTVPILAIKEQSKTIKRRPFKDYMRENRKLGKTIEGEMFSVVLTPKGIPHSIEIKWSARIIKANGLWKVSFSPVKLSRQCKRALEYGI